MQAALEDLKARVAMAGRILYRLGLVDYLGHVSARLGDRVVIKPKHSPTVHGLGSLDASRMIVADLDGNLLEGDERPPAEIYIHTSIYKARPDVRAIAHTHQPAATLMGILEAPIRPLLHIPSSYVDQHDVGAWPHAALVTDAAMGADLAEALADHTFCHLQGHGIVAVGESVEEATVLAAMLEESSNANLEVLKTGIAPREISEPELMALREYRGPVAGRWAYFESLLDTGADDA